MGVLVDTHVVLWWLGDDATLDSAVRDRLDVDPEISVSVVSIWEAGIKQSLGKLTGDGNLAERIRDAGFTLVPVVAGHAVAAGALPLHHRDPFDRMLVAQATVEGLTVMTRDRAFGAYDVPVEYV